MVFAKEATISSATSINIYDDHSRDDGTFSLLEYNNGALYVVMGLRILP